MRLVSTAAPEPVGLNRVSEPLRAAYILATAYSWFASACPLKPAKKGGSCRPRGKPLEARIVGYMLILIENKHRGP